MKLAKSLSTGVAALALSASTAWAEPLPDRALGVWGVESCSGDDFAVLVNSSFAILVEGPQGRPSVAVGKAEWAAGSIIVILDDEANELILPPLESLRRCEALPGVAPVLFAETIAVFGRLDEIDAACRGESGITARCVALAFDIVDVTGDGRFSKAEISRAVRAAGFFVGYRIAAGNRGSAFVPLEELYLAQVAAATLGPFLAANLIDSYDFGGDGFVSLAELMQDRAPDKGLEGALAGVALGMAPETLATAMKSVTGILGMLK